MTILVTADLHLNNLARDKYRHDFQKQLRSLVIKHRVSVVVIAGDLADEKDFHSATLVNKVVDCIYELSRLAPIIILKGNHDYTSITETPFFTFLQRIENVSWVGEPTPSSELNNLPATAVEALQGSLFLPHTPNPTRDWVNTPLKDYDWIFAHQTFGGAEGDNGHQLEGTPTSIFPKGSRVISGDVHVPQTLGPVTYVGSPYHVDFGDSFSPRMLIIKNNKLQSIPCDGPQKRLIKVPVGEGLPKLSHNLATGDIVKVKIELGIGQYAEWAKIKDGVYAWGHKHGLVVHLVQPVTKQINATKKTIKRQDPKSDVELLKVYAKSKAADERTIKVGVELLGQA